MINLYKCNKCKSNLLKKEVKATYIVKNKRVFLCEKCRGIINHYLSSNTCRTDIINHIDEGMVKLYFERIKHGNSKGKNISVQRVKCRNKKAYYRIVKTEQ